MTWQPIETAPRDGTVILVWQAGKGRDTIITDWFAVESNTGACGWLDEPTHWQPLPPPPTPQCDTAAFLAFMANAIETGERVTADDVARLRRLADWADAPPPAGWNGTLDKHEGRRAIEAAVRRMRDE